MTLQREKSLLNRAQEERPVKRQNRPRPRSRLVWKLTVNPMQPLLSLLDQEFALVTIQESCGPIQTTILGAVL